MANNSERNLKAESKFTDVSVSDDEKPINELPQILQNIGIEFEISRARVGTFELPAYRFNSSKLKNREALIRSKYSKETNTWNNAHKLVIEDWKLNLEIYEAIYTILILLIDQKLLINKKIESLDKQLIDVMEYHDKIKSGMSIKFKNKAETKKYLLESKYDSKKVYKQQKIKTLSDAIVNQNFPGILDRLEASVKYTINSLPDKSLVGKNSKN